MVINSLSVTHTGLLQNPPPGGDMSADERIVLLDDARTLILQKDTRHSGDGWLVAPVTKATEAVAAS